MESIWGLGCKPHLYPYASHMTSHIVYIWVSSVNATGVTQTTKLGVKQKW